MAGRCLEVHWWQGNVASSIRVEIQENERVNRLEKWEGG